MTRRQLRRRKRTPQRALASLLARYDWNLLFDHQHKVDGLSWSPVGQERYRIYDPQSTVGAVGKGHTPHEAIRAALSEPPAGRSE